MKILNLATTDENAAGVACRNMNDMFLQAGHQSILLVKESASAYPGVITLNKKKYGVNTESLFFKIKYKFSQLYRLFFPFEKDDKYSFHNVNEGLRSATGAEIVKKLPFKPDLILVYWVSGFINMETINELAGLSNARIILMMTDNAPLTGGCHYPWDCKGFHHDCADCPAILTPSRKKIASRNLALKKAHMPEKMELMSSSDSDYNRAKASSLFKDKQIYKLIAPIDETKFKPGSKAEARAHFGINAEKKVIFYGANSFTDPRKGSVELLAALKIVCKNLEESKLDGLTVDNVVILLAGKEGQDFFKDIPFEIKSVGFLRETELITAYQAADFMVSPSLEDSGPMMINQSVMCGTPMVTFDIGVAMNIVRTGETGYRAKLGDTTDLAAGIFSMLSISNEALDRMSFQCRQFALQEITPDVYAERIMKLF